MKIKIKKVYLGVDICVIITYISIKLNKPMENRMTNSNLKFVASDEIRQDNIRAMSNVWSRWCEFHGMPKHDNGNYYSLDDIMINHYQDLDFEPSIQQIKFMVAFRDVWDQIEAIEQTAL